MSAQNKAAANRQLIEHFYECLGRGDADAVENCYSDDVIFNLIGDTPVSGRWIGKADCWGVVAARVFSALDPTTLSFSRKVRIVCTDESHVVAMMQGGATATNGTVYDQTYCHIFNIQDGQIIEMHEFFDTVLAEASLFDNPLLKPTGRAGKPFDIG